MLRTGVDLLHLDRFVRVLERHPVRFRTRVFTEREQHECSADQQALAGRFALKEATAKALGTGLWRVGVAWRHIEIARHPGTGAPELHLHAAAARIAAAQHLEHWAVSLTHDGQYVLAFVVAYPVAWNHPGPTPGKHG